VLESAIRKVQKNQVGYADEVDLLGDNIDTIKEHTETLIDASVRREVNTEKTRHMLLSCDWNAGQNHDIKIAETCFKNVAAQFKYLGTTVTNQNLIQEEMKRILNFYYACYYSAQNLLYSHLLSKNLKITTYKTIIFSCGSVWI
jgi:hypothetical protein